MKFTLEKKAILLSEIDDAKAIAIDRQWMLDKDVIKSAMSNCLTKHYGEDVYVDEIIKIQDAKIAKNHYELRPHVTALVKYYKDGFKLAEISTDLVESYEYQNGECFMITYGETFCGIVK